MRTESLNHKYVYGSALPASRLVVDVADKHQRCTQSYVRRPYGVGLLVSLEFVSACSSLCMCCGGCQAEHANARVSVVYCPQLASYDQTGPHLYQTDPSGNFYE